MSETLASFVWQYSKRDQLLILAITCLSFPLVYLSLEIPKWIINRAIGGDDFPVDFFGIQLEQIPYLFVLSMLFLLMIVLNNGIKFALNMYKGIVGERMLRRLRYMLYQQVLRFRPSAYRKVSGDQLIPMITSEVEDLSGYIGEAVATPAFQGGTLAVYIVFIFVQNIWLGLLSISLYPLQAYVIPHLQGHVNRLVRKRVTNIREIAEKVGETVGGVEEIHVHDTTNYHGAQLSDHLQTNYDLRLGIYKQKYLIKFLNNFLNKFPTFLFYLIGGYFAIIGDLTVGALVAVIGAYADITGPWKELLGYYQLYATSSVKYKAIVENFQPDEIYPQERLLRPEPAARVDGALVLSGVGMAGRRGSRTLSGIDLTVQPGECFAVIGDDLSGRSQLLNIISGLSEGDGEVNLGSRSITSLSEAELGRSIARIGAATYLYNDTVGANIAYALRHRPIDASANDDRERERRIAEAIATGNSPYDIDSLWDDIDASGVGDTDDLRRRAVELLQRLGMDENLFDFGMNTQIDPTSHPDLVEQILIARNRLRAEIRRSKRLSRNIELYDIDRYMDNATIAMNILFATAKDSTLKMRNWVDDPQVRDLLEECQLIQPLVEISTSLTSIMIDLFSSHDTATLSASHSLLSNDEYPHFETILNDYNVKGPSGLTPEQRSDLLAFAFRIEPARYPIVEIDNEMQKRFLDARLRFHDMIAENPTSQFEPIHPDKFLSSMSIGGNLLEGRIRRDRQNANERVLDHLRKTIDHLGLTEAIEEIGLDYIVGVGGVRLNAFQRRSVAYARALIKRPHLLVVDAVTSSDISRLSVVQQEMTDGIVLLGGAEVEPMRRIADHFIQLDRGTVAGHGGKDDLSKVSTSLSSQGTSWT